MIKRSSEEGGFIRAAPSVMLALAEIGCLLEIKLCMAKDLSIGRRSNT